MMEKFGYKNPNSCPKIEKIVVNSGFGKMIADKGSNERKKIQEHILKSISLITGQKACLRKAKKSISSFKLREGMPIGAQVTLRGKKMYSFLEKLIWLVLPRARDFRGIPLKSINQEGNLTIGFEEYIPFPELIVEKEKGIFGLEVTVVSGAQSKEEGIELLKLIGFPLKGLVREDEPGAKPER